MTTRSEQIAWAAGLFEGEGSASFIVDKRRKNYKYPRLQIKMTDLIILERFCAIVETGQIYTLKPDRKEHKTPYLWIAYGQPALLVGLMLRPWLGPRRIQQIDELFDCVAGRKLLDPV